ncbi:DgaE family pyridoxal phosphate-dependent ammonia lyase [Clostridioides difficile]|uniref:DgaE family pyridoxal phosphate-dependent ammonia lyase n=1 Tax=Clostridioides difficile TaxID=1496 RepID=UPI00097FD70B|nr:DgaE family pyridoxal phosphate-dependent ammonia lyase [Clostridioides difficile]EKS6837063.1 DgaE family pyridoxal phosphate-dependent ammonia lyase [Clostridioides difficile]MCO5818825.1 DgaE family pyridoxal phosphate-dependent ammonia lyase [Clostridioides difficile]MDE3651563.1 DgaE family pyridoxal phosphate-dependent ammonia lyase [Clostridioides difficile]MDK3372307.1 DgaE family pyridoxal phosphate-dependent ammonia lyase [Clostridioides difficile]SJW71578.1 selenocysteine synthas
MSSIFEKYSVRRVINASGKMTILGVSTVDKEVIEAIGEGCKNFFIIEELINKTGEYIANLLGCESALIVSSASAGIAQSVGAMIAKDDMSLVYNVNNPKKQVKREIIIPKGHNVDYGVPVEVMIRLGGGEVVEAGYANMCNKEHIIREINENTAAIMYIKSHHCVQKSMLSVLDAVQVAKEYNLPLIVDAAAEDLNVYYELGADLVIYSGAKAIEGPSSGLVIGKKKYIDNVKLQSKGIGRAMKIGKENIVGLTCAIERYISNDKVTLKEMEDKLNPFIDKINTIKGVSASITRDSAGREILRGEIDFNEDIINKSTQQIINELRSGEIAIYTRDYKANEGKIEIDIRSVTGSDLDTIYNRIKNIVES